MRISALLNIGALSTILAWSAAEFWDPSVITPRTWFPFMGLLLLPYGAIVWCLETGRVRGGLLWAAAWGSAASFALVPWVFVSNFHLRYTQPVWYLLLLSLVTPPIQIVMASSALKVLRAEPGRASWLRSAMVFAFLYGGFVGFGGLAGMPHRYMIFAGEVTATATLRALHVAESEYWKKYNSGYTDILRRLCPPAIDRSASADSADLVDVDLCGSGENGTPNTFTLRGYFFTYAAQRRNGMIQGFSLRADPISRGASGQRSFYVDETGVIRANAVQPATATDNPI